MKTFRQSLQSDSFVMTAQLLLNSGDGPKEILRQAGILQDAVSAIQIPENPLEPDQLSALAAATVLIRNGMDAIPEINGRDRNRIALMSDLLGMRALGINSIIIGESDQGQQRPADTTGPAENAARRDLISMAESLNQDESISPGEEFLIGTQVRLDPTPTDVSLADLGVRASAGARFLQVQPCFDMDVLRDFMQRLVDAQLTWNYAVMVSLAPLQSVDAAYRLRDQQRGCVIPPSIIDRLATAGDPRKEGVEICSELIRETRAIPGVTGVKLITMEYPQDVVTAIRESAG